MERNRRGRRRHNLKHIQAAAILRRNIFCFRGVLTAFLVIAIAATATFASPVTISSKSLQTTAGELSNIYFQNTSGPGSSTPSTNTAMTLTSSSGSYTLATSSNAYLWSPQFTSATTINAGNWILGFWAGSTSYIYAYVPITLTNSQTSGTPATCQVKITWNPSSYTSYEASNLGNIRFYSGSTFTTQLYAWLESCTPSLSNTATSATAWVKLTSSIAGNGGTATIYMAFLSTSTTYDGNYWGQAPNLSSTYGQYDNGANVFNFYDNFAGTSLNPKWTIFGSSQGTISVSNGITITSSSSTHLIGIYASYTPPTTGIVTEAYFTATNPTAGYRVFNGNGMTSSSTTEQNGYVGILEASGGANINLDKMVSGTATILASASDALTAGNNYENSLLWQSSTLNMTDLTNGHSAAASDTTYSLSSMTQVALAIGAQSGNKYVTYWFRARQSSPNGVMPSASFGVISNTVNELSISIYVTDSLGNIQSTIASNVQSSISASEGQYTLNFAGNQVSIPLNGYLLVELSSTSTASYTFYWGNGQPTNFQVPDRTLT